MIIKSLSISNMVAVDSCNLPKEKFFGVTFFFLRFLTFFSYILTFLQNICFMKCLITQKYIFKLLYHPELCILSIKEHLCPSTLGYGYTNIIYKQSSWPAHLLKQVQWSLRPGHPETASVVCRSQLACWTLPVIRSPAYQLESMLLEPDFILSDL